MSNDKTYKKHGRISDYASNNRNVNNDTVECLACEGITYFDDRICGVCRSIVPTHIPIAQVQKYVLRIKKGKDYVPTIQQENA